jgi:hypothetical protein
MEIELTVVVRTDVLCGDSSMRGHHFTERVKLLAVAGLINPRIPPALFSRSAHIGLIRAARHTGYRQAPVAEISSVAITERKTLASRV